MKYVKNIVILLLFAICLVLVCKQDHKFIEGEKYVLDSLTTTLVENKIIIDSLENTIRNYESSEFLLSYKIERIKYYNDIAAKGNNIKYLRGWINRTLEE